MLSHDLLTPTVELAACAGPAALALTLARLRLRLRVRRRADAQAARWEQILAAAHRHPDARLGQVVAVHQHARTGTKAWVRWHQATAVQDVWFRGIRAGTGTWYLVTGFDRYGPHRHEPHLFDVTELLMTAPATAPCEWLRRQTPPRTTPPG